MTGQEGMTGQISSPSTSMSSPQNVSLRSKTPQIDWNQCIFCQQKKKASLHLIQEMNVSKRILEAAQYDQFLRVRLACVNDLTAADGKYHRNCLTDFDRRSKHMENISLTSPEIVLAWLCQELEHAAEQADILDLVDVWARFCDISDSVQIDIPSSFQTRRNTFKEKLADRLKGIYEIIVLHDQPRTEPRTVLVPSKFRHIPVSEMVNDEGNDTERPIPSFKHHDQDTFLSMVHVALQIRGDMLSHLKPDGLEISENRAINSIPDSLYMFLNLLLGGQCLLEGDELDDDKKEAKRRLVNMFNHAGHVMSYREVIKLDNALGKKTLDTMDGSGAVIPPNLVKGRFLHFSTDNVDINEYTLDGKGTFHATQVAAWQRGPAESDLLSGIEFSKARTLHIPDVMTEE